MCETVDASKLILRRRSRQCAIRLKRNYPWWLWLRGSYLYLATLRQTVALPWLSL